ncbi:uncharacterized protein [Elaeis guineensis]|uniref:uncharacterized protein n=1 Tax=Elaeis guineensis var. tenera TaxID=51953 RepID=UPI003C6D8C79
MGEMPVGMVPDRADKDGAGPATPASATSNHFFFFYLLSGHRAGVDGAGAGSGRCGWVGRVGLGRAGVDGAGAGRDGDGDGDGDGWAGSDGSGRVRPRRGPTVVRDVWQMCEGERIVVECNQLGQPIKKAACLLTSFLGTVARRPQLCPLGYAKWNDMLPTYKVELLRVIESKFVLPPSTHDFVMKSLNRKWKEYKAQLKKDYMRQGMTEEEVARNCPPDVPPHQWMELVHYWFSERAQTYSAIGRAARAAQSVPHTSGSKSYARLRQEFEDEHGREPGQVEFYRMTHTHQDGTFVRDESRDLYERATSLIAERDDESAASTQQSRIEAEVFTELMGPERYGRVRGYGVGVTPTQLSEVSRYTQHAATDAQDSRVRRLEAEIQEIRQSRAAEMEEMRQSRAEMQAMRGQIDRLTSLLEMYGSSQWKAVFRTGSFQVSIVDADPLFLVGLFHHDYVGKPVWICGFSDKSCCE